MDLSILQKVNELVEQGRNADDIKHELQAGGISPETIDAALAESGVSANQQASQPTVPLSAHHEKVIQPEPGFDPHAK